MINKFKQVGSTFWATLAGIIIVAVVLYGLYLFADSYGVFDASDKATSVVGGVKQQTEEDDEYCNQPNVDC